MDTARRRGARRGFFRRSGTLLALLLIALLLRGAEAQAPAVKPAAFAGVVGWQVRLQVEYENTRGTFAEHATSVWTGTIYANDQPPQSAASGDLPPQPSAPPYWVNHDFLNPPLLEWYGDVDVTADYDSAWTSEHPTCRSQGSGHDAHRERIYLSISDAGYTVRTSGGGITATVQEHCEPPYGDHTYPNQPVDYSVNIEETNPLPAQGWRLSGSASRDGEGTNGHFRQTMSWEITTLEKQNYVCGPDVTADLDATLRQIQTWFAGLERAQKIEQCETLHSLVSGQRA